MASRHLICTLDLSLIPCHTAISQNPKVTVVVQETAFTHLLCEFLSITSPTFSAPNPTHCVFLCIPTCRCPMWTHPQQNSLLPSASLSICSSWGSSGHPTTSGHPHLHMTPKPMVNGAHVGITTYSTWPPCWTNIHSPIYRISPRGWPAPGYSPKSVISGGTSKYLFSPSRPHSACGNSSACRLGSSVQAKPSSL